MDITSISGINSDYISKITEAAAKTSALSSASDNATTGTTTFDSIFNAVSGLVNNTNDYIQQAQQAEIDFSLGNITSTHELGVYQQQANIALQYTVAIRDKAIEAYKEIMSMSI